MKTIINAIQERHDRVVKLSIQSGVHSGVSAHNDRQILLDIIRDIGELRTHVPPTAPMSVVWKSDIDLIINRTEP